MPKLDEALTLLDAVYADLTAYSLRKNGPGRELLDRVLKQLNSARAPIVEAIREQAAKIRKES